MTVWPRTQQKRERAYARYAHCFVFSHHLLITTPSQPFRRDGRRRRPVPHLNDEEGCPFLSHRKLPINVMRGCPPRRLSSFNAPRAVPLAVSFQQRDEGPSPSLSLSFQCNVTRGCPPRRLSFQHRRGAVPLAVSLLPTQRDEGLSPSPSLSFQHRREVVPSSSLLSTR